MEEKETIKHNGTEYEKHSEVQVIHTDDGTLEVTSYWREEMSKGLLDGVKHRKLKVGEVIKEGDQCRNGLGGWNKVGLAIGCHARGDGDCYRPIETEPKGLIIDGVEHRKLEAGTKMIQGDRYKGDHGRWSHGTPGFPVSSFIGVYRPIEETYEILGKNYRMVSESEPKEYNDICVILNANAEGQQYREVKTEAKPPPEAFVKKIAMECGTVEGYAPSDFIHWLESVS